MTRTCMDEIQSVSECVSRNHDFSEYLEKHHLTHYLHPTQNFHAASDISYHLPHDTKPPLRSLKHAVSSERKSEFAHFKNDLMRHRYHPAAMFCRYCVCPNCTNVNWYLSHPFHFRPIYDPDLLQYPAYLDNRQNTYFKTPLRGSKATQHLDVLVDDSVLDKEVEMINNHNLAPSRYTHHNTFCVSPYYFYETDKPYPFYEFPRAYSYPCFYPYRTTHSGPIRRPLKRKFSDTATDPIVNSYICIERSISPALSDLTDCQSCDDDDDYNHYPIPKISTIPDDTRIWKRKSGAKVLKLLLDDGANDERFKEPPPIQRNAKAKHFNWDVENRAIRTVSPRSS